MNPSETWPLDEQPQPFAEGAKTCSFATTRWSMVLDAGQLDTAHSAAALEELCCIYWYPIYAFVRRRGSDPHEAEDLTQSFFAFLLEHGSLRAVDPAKGKFRSFLLASLTNFLNNEWHKRRTLKRGGARRIVSLDEVALEERYSLEPVDPFTPENLFDRGWVVILLDRVFDRLKQEYTAEGNAAVFANLETALTGDVVDGAYDQWAATLRMSKGAIKVALHRLRRRFGDGLRREIAHTVASPAEVEDEIRHLFAAMSACAV